VSIYISKVVIKREEKQRKKDVKPRS